MNRYLTTTEGGRADPRDIPGWCLRDRFRPVGLVYWRSNTNHLVADRHDEDGTWTARRTDLPGVAQWAADARAARAEMAMFDAEMIGGLTPDREAEILRAVRMAGYGGKVLFYGSGTVAAQHRGTYFAGRAALLGGQIMRPDDLDAHLEQIRSQAALVRSLCSTIEPVYIAQDTYNWSAMGNPPLGQCDARAIFCACDAVGASVLMFQPSLLAPGELRPAYCELLRRAIS